MQSPLLKKQLKVAGPQGDGQTQHTNHQQDNITKTDPKDPFPKKEARSFKNSIVMVSVSGNAAVQVMQAAAKIPDEELGVDGRENDPHVTIKFGVKDDPELLKTTLRGFTPFSVRLGKLKVFIPSEASGRQAPVVAEALSPQLKVLHDKVDSAMSVRPDDFAFSPHVTLAYLKPEVAKKYEGSDMVEGLSFLVDHVVLSRADRTKIEISLEQAKAVSAADHKFAPDRGHGREDVLVAVDPAKLDAEWQRDHGFYVGPGGEGGIHGRYERFQRWLQDNPSTPIGAPIVSWNDVTNCPSFVNGRHRFAVLRDMGVKKVYISVPKEQKEIFKKFASHKTPPLSDTQYQNMNDTSGEGTNAYADIRERVKDTREETPLEVLNPDLFKQAEDDFPKVLFHGTTVPSAQAIMREGFNKHHVWWTSNYARAEYYAKMQAKAQKQDKYAVLKLDALRAGFRPINLRNKDSGDVHVSHWPIPSDSFIGYDSKPFDGVVPPMPLTAARAKNLTFQSRPLSGKRRTEMLENGEVIGKLDIRLWENYEPEVLEGDDVVAYESRENNTPPKGTVFVEDSYIAPKFRGEGYGSRLYQLVDPKEQNLEKLMAAIGRAEGARPERHNPGNLADGTGKIKTFKSDAEGKAALKQQLERISQGVHPHIKPNHTLEQAGLIYSNGDPNWAHNVSLIMRVPKHIKMKDLIDGKYTPRPPRPKKTGADAAPMTLLQSLEALRPQMVAVAQKVYDENVAANVEDPDGEHGICDEIAQEIQGVIVQHVSEVEVSEGGQDGDDHAWVIAYRGKEVYGVDIAPSVYESGGGYSWKLHEGVKIDPSDVEIFKIDMDPEQLKLSFKVAARARAGGISLGRP